MTLSLLAEKQLAFSRPIILLNTVSLRSWLLKRENAHLKENVLLKIKDASIVNPVIYFVGSEVQAFFRVAN
ncbi:MAG: hypothetical protein ACI8PB_004756 [Desulforhopalus sp.]|jgi:hypothetical protein